MKLPGWLLFLKEVLTKPLQMGAAVPSSKKLAKVMADQLPLANDGYVIELGAGTGVITKALLEHGVPAEKLIAFERSFRLVEHLRAAFPDVRVIYGDARYMRKYLRDDTLKITGIVSGLPLRIMPREMVDDISVQIKSLLAEDGIFIQFTYGWFSYHSPIKDLSPLSSLRVWGNLPPARVDIYQK